MTPVPNEPYLQLLLDEPSHTLLRSVTSNARRIGQTVLLESTAIDLHRTSLASQTLDELIDGHFVQCSRSCPIPAIRHENPTNCAAISPLARARDQRVGSKPQ